ncbi:hypothetical protein BDZ89DRAFT_967363 [Hymenopellis radicata]|nr:hypothetical protein BDZ89DRAFT_967363 [Hymenopellis radicata]
MRLVFLPPYSPDFDPIEEGFSAMKAWLRRNQDFARLHLGNAPDCNPHALLNQAVFESMTPQSIHGWFHHSHYV